MTSSAVAPGTDSLEVVSMEERRPVDDGLTLGGDCPDPEGCFGLGFGFGLFDLEDLVGVRRGSLCAATLGTLGGVDVVHCGFDL